MFAANVTPESLAKFNTGLEEFAREAGWSMEYTSLSAAAWLCRNTMWYTPPFVDGSFEGTTKDAENAGVGALTRDINRIFKALDARKKKTGPGILLHRIATAARLGRMSEYFDAQAEAKNVPWEGEIVSKIVNDPDPVRGYYKARNYFATYSMTEVKKLTIGLEANELRKVHDNLKKTRGGRMRISKPSSPVGYYLVKSMTALSNYIKERSNMVGRLKSGWWRVMQTLPKPKKKGTQGTVGGVREIARFIKRHGGSAGYQTTNFSPTNFNVVIGNRIGDTDSIASRVNAPGLAMVQTEKHLAEQIRLQIERDVSRFNQG